MNELIKKFEKQCWDHQTNHLNSEKFAELIIKECLEQVRDEVQYEYDWELADAVTQRVLEHFGVQS